MFRPHLSYIAAISVNRRTSGYPWRGGPVRSNFQWCLLYPVNLRCLARSGRWRQRSSEWLGMLVIMLWTSCQVLISHLHNSWILNHSNVYLVWSACTALPLTVHTSPGLKLLSRMFLFSQQVPPTGDSTQHPPLTRIDPAFVEVKNPIVINRKMVKIRICMVMVMILMTQWLGQIVV